MNARKTVLLAFFMAAGILMQLIESFFPVVMIVPGYKIGLANIAALFVLYAYGPKEAAAVSLGRIFLACLLQGTLFSVAFWLSLCGGICSLIVMIVFYKLNFFSIYGVSVLGACFHSIGQVIAITFIYQQYFMQLFLPVLLALSIASGLCIALLASQLLMRLYPKIG